MKKIAVLTLTLASLISLKALAEVQFLPEATENLYIKSSSSTATSDSDRCRNAGYVYTSCEGALAEECPYQNGFYRTCCPAGYTHTLSECTGNISSDSCAGYYKCDTVSAGDRCLAEGWRSLPAPVPGISYVRPCDGQGYDLCPYDNGYYKCRTISISPTLPRAMPIN